MTHQPTPVDSAVDAAYAKELDALHRGVPKTRMLDYGMHGHDAAEVAALADTALAWDEVCETLANRRESLAQASLERNRPVSAAQQLEWAGAALIVGQLRFNHDIARKRAMLMRSNQLFVQAARLAGNRHCRVTLPDASGHGLHAWKFPVADPIACVVVVGGLSGWGAAYFSMARAFGLRGLATIIVEGPGQGETRMNNGLYLSREALGSFDSVIAAAAVAGGGRVGIMGNSFGGLVAAHVAARTPAIQACCINGAVPAVSVPPFRTAREQMEAAFGASGDALEALVAEFTFDPARTPIAAPVLIVEGGADPLVPLGAQRGFVDATAPHPDVITWPDGEHTIYNHAGERNALVAAWFADQLESK